MSFRESRVLVFLHGRPVDMRESFTGLIALTKRALGQDLLSGHLFVFISRKGDYLKARCFDRTGFRLCAKRLERRRFISRWTGQHDRELDVTALKLLLEGNRRVENPRGPDRARRPCLSFRSQKVILTGT
jgi:transposase